MAKHLSDYMLLGKKPPEGFGKRLPYDPVMPHGMKLTIDVADGAGGGKSGGGSSHTPKEDPNTLRSRAIARIVDLYSEGPVVGIVDGAKGIYLNDTPLQNQDGTYNFEGISWEERIGLDDQDYIEGFSSAEAEVTVGTELKQSVGPIVRTISDTDIDAVRLTIRIPQLTNQDVTTGDLHGSSVRFTIEHKEVGAVSWILNFDVTLTGKCTSAYEEQFRVPLQGTGPWQVRLTRITPDSAKVTLLNTTFWSSYTTIIDNKFQYPNSAYVGLSADSQLFGSSIPRRAYKVRGRIISVPSNYDPETRIYTGIWDGTFIQAYSDNPAWCLYDMLINDRYGLSAYIPQEFVDKTAFYDIGKYCDELVPDGYGGTEPRFRLAIQITTAQQAHTVLNLMVSVFRGMIYWATNTVACTYDGPRDIDVIANTGNVVDGVFTYTSPGDKARHNLWKITWNDPEDMGRPAIEVTQDNRDIIERGLRVLETMSWGAASRGQALRTGRWLRYSEKHESLAIKYRTGIEGAFALPGHIVAVVDPHRAGAQFGGRILSVIGNSVTLDRACDLSGSPQQLWVMNVDGTVQIRDITQSGAAFNVVTVTSTLSPTPAAGAIFAISSADLTPRLFRVVSVRESEPTLFDVDAVAHYPDKYSIVEQGYEFQEGAFTTISSGPVAAPLDLSMGERLYLSNGVLKTRVTFSWQKALDSRVILFEFTYRIKRSNVDGTFDPDTDYGPWITRVVSEPVLTLDDADTGTYEVYLYALTGTMRSTAGHYPDILVVGKSAPPDDVTGLVATRDFAGITLSWDAVDDLDLVGYEIREGTTWDAGVALTTNHVSTSFFIQVLDGLNHTYHVKAVDQLGIYSTGVATVSASVLVPPAPTSFVVIQQQNSLIGFSWVPDPAAPAAAEYEIREGLSWDSSQFLFSRSGTQSTVILPGSGTRTFWIKTISAAGIYSASAVVYVLDQAPDDYNVVASFDQLALSWPGINWNLETNISPDGLKIKATSPSGSYKVGEYHFKEDLTTQYRARNWLSYKLNDVAAAGITWDDATMTWDDAEFEWTPTGDISGITAEPVISLFTGPVNASDIYGFRCESDTADFRVGSLTASQAAGTTYAALRFTNGLQMQTGRQISWDTLSIPSEFTLMFAVKYSTLQSSGTTRVMQLNNTGNGRTIFVDYDKTNLRWVLGDSNGAALYVPHVVQTDDIVYLCVVQGASARSLFVYDIGDDQYLQNTAATAPWATSWDRLSPYSYNTGTYNGVYVIGNILVSNLTFTLQDFTDKYVEWGPVGYGQFYQLIPGEYDYRYAILGLRVRAPVISDTVPAITELIHYVDVPDLTQTGTVSLGASSATVTFGEAYKVAPVVMASFVTGATLGIPEVTSITTTGFSIALKRSASPFDIIAGTVAWTAKGY